MQRGYSRGARESGKNLESVRGDLGSNFGLGITFDSSNCLLPLLPPNLRGGSLSLTRSRQKIHTEEESVHPAAAPTKGSHLIASLLQLELKVQDFASFPSNPIPARLLALETFTVFAVSSLISFSIFPLCPRESLCTKLLVGKSGRVCFSRCLRCPRESPPPGADSQSNSPGNSPMLCFLGFKTSGWKLSLRVDL